MSAIHLESTVKQGIERLEGSVAELIDHSQALARGALIEAAHAFQHSREQARDAAHDALDYSRGKALRSYGRFESAASRQPLAATLIGVGLGLVLGYILHTRATAKQLPAPRPRAALGKGASARVAPTRARAKPAAAAKKAPTAKPARRAPVRKAAPTPANGSLQ